MSVAKQSEAMSHGRGGESRGLIDLFKRGPPLSMQSRFANARWSSTQANIFIVLQFKHM